MQPVWHLRICQTLIILLFNQLTECYWRRMCDPDTMSVPVFPKKKRSCYDSMTFRYLIMSTLPGYYSSKIYNHTNSNLHLISPTTGATGDNHFSVHFRM
jgi:hypothetical protein